METGHRVEGTNSVSVGSMLVSPLIMRSTQIHLLSARFGEVGSDLAEKNPRLGVLSECSRF